MKGIFIYYKKINPDKMTGIDKKVMNQIDTFNAQGLECELMVVPFAPTTVSKFTDRLPFTNVDPVWKYDSKLEGIDFLYFRRPFYMNMWMRHLLKEVKKRNPNVKIIIEIPTYPYDQEVMSSVFNFPLHWKDKYNRKRLKGLVDRFAVIGKSDEQLWGIPVIPFVNGINTDKIQVKKVLPKEDNSIHIICVSTFEFWHGYDRLFEGLKTYYQHDPQREIYLHIVGDGLQKEQYVELVQKSNIEKYVKFYGMIFGEELDEIYDQCDIACASLGVHRIGISVGSFLKTREYLSKGLPMITGCAIDILDDDYKYVKIFPGDETSIDFEQIIAFYNKVYNGQESRSDVVQNIRQFAENTVDMKVTMKEITDYIAG